jgi:hypothetical protein
MRLSIKLLEDQLVGTNIIDNSLAEYEPSELPDDVKTEMTKVMAAQAKHYGMDLLRHASL